MAGGGGKKVQIEIELLDLAGRNSTAEIGNRPNQHQHQHPNAMVQSVNFKALTTLASVVRRPYLASPHVFVPTVSGKLFADGGWRRRGSGVVKDVAHRK